MSLQDLDTAITLGTARAKAHRHARPLIAVGDPDEISNAAASYAGAQSLNVIRVQGSANFGAELFGQIDARVWSPLPPSRITGIWQHDVAEALSDLYDTAAGDGEPVILIVSHLNDIPKKDLGDLVEIVHRAAQTQAPLIFVGVGTEGVHGLLGDARCYAETLFQFVSVPSVGGPEI